MNIQSEQIDLKVVELAEGMRRINVIKESKGLPIFKTVQEYLNWRESEIEYDN